MTKASDIHWQAGSIGSKTGLDTAKKGKPIPAPPGKQNSRFFDRTARSLFPVLRCQIKLRELDTPQAQI